MNYFLRTCCKLNDNSEIKCEYKQLEESHAKDKVTIHPIFKGIVPYVNPLTGVLTFSLKFANFPIFSAS